MERLSSKQSYNPEEDTIHIASRYRKTALQLLSFFRDVDIHFKRVSDTPWNSMDAYKITKPSLSPDYFGLLDTIHLKQRDGTVELYGIKKKEADVLSVSINGSILNDQVPVSKKSRKTEFLLDTGFNFMTLFADNFGNDLPNEGKLVAQIANRKLILDFNNKADSAATFIVAQLVFDKDEAENRNFENYIPSFVSKGDTLKPDERLLGSIIATSRQLTFALWDDAIEDGDSVSIKIGNQWIVRGFPVLKRVQFLTVTLNPGLNEITFLGDNLGSIPPNTSVLEIIDGKKRKAFFIETVPGEKNMIKILYDLKPNPE